MSIYMTHVELAAVEVQCKVEFFHQKKESEDRALDGKRLPYPGCPEDVEVEQMYLKVAAFDGADQVWAMFWHDEIAANMRQQILDDLADNRRDWESERVDYHYEQIKDRRMMEGE
jgi:hypothetical protein